MCCLLSVGGGHWQLFGAGSSPRGGAGGLAAAPQQQVHILGRLVTSPALATPVAHGANSLNAPGYDPRSAAAAAAAAGGAGGAARPG